MSSLQSLEKAHCAPSATQNLSASGSRGVRVASFVGVQSPSSTVTNTYTGINKLPLDSEALILKADGSGYVGDEYGANIYYFNPVKQIIGVATSPTCGRSCRHP